MKLAKWGGISVCVAVVISSLPVVTSAFDVKLTPEQIKEASEYGTRYKGTDVFSSPVVKQACFGSYPNGEGGIVMSSYILTVVISAMVNLKAETVTPEKLKEIQELTTFKVIVLVSGEDAKVPEDVKIMMVQGTNDIPPQKTLFRGASQGHNMLSIDCTYQLDKINPKTNTTIIARTRKNEKHYNIDFLDIK